jgi:hypothetical protein
MKRVVILEMKAGPPKMNVYPNCPELVLDNGKQIGITLNSLWNALSKGKGIYENKKCKIYYKELKKWKK